MPKPSRQKKYLSNAYLEFKANSKDDSWEKSEARGEIIWRNVITRFIRGGNNKRDLLARSQGVTLLFRKSSDVDPDFSKGTIIQLCVYVDDAMTREDYIANWPIVHEYVRQIKEVQGVWNEARSRRFLEMFERMRVSSKGKMGYGKLAQWINRRIERQLRAAEQNKLIQASVPGLEFTEEWYDKAIAKGYDRTVDIIEAYDLIRCFRSSEKDLKEIHELILSAEESIHKGKPVDFAIGRHAYTWPVTTAHVRAKLKLIQRHISK